MKTLFLIFAMVTQIMAGDYIDTYASYTNGKRVLIEGRLIDTKDRYTKDSSVMGAFFNDEKKGITVHLKIAAQDFSTISDDEGYFSFDVKVHKRLAVYSGLSLYTKDKDSLRKITPLHPSDKRQIGIISDFDDTVLVSNVTQKAKLLYNTFFKDYKERQIVKEAQQKIVSLVKSNHLRGDTALFFITGSPHQLNHTIHAFLDFHHFPKRTVLSKKIQGDNKDSLHASIAYKYDKIVRLITMYPNVKWVFLGDNGERDPDIYRKVLKEHPKAVSAIYIRDAVKDGTGKLSKLFPK